MHRHFIGILIVQHAGEAFDHDYKLIKGRKGTCPETKLLCIFQDFPERDVVFIGGQDQPVHRSLANSPGRVVDHPFDRFFITWIYNNAEISHQVFDFLALVETDTAIDCIRDGHPAQGFLKGTALGIGPVKNRKILIAVMIAEFLFLYTVRYKFTFIIIRHGPDQFDLLALPVIGKQYFLDLSFVVLDYFIGHMKYALGTAVILFQLHHFHFIVVLLELQDVFNRGTTEGVDTLCIIPHHAYIFMHGPQEFDHFILSGVGILVLIDEDVFEFVLVLGKTLRYILQQFIKFKQEVIKIHRAVFKTTLYIGIIDLPDSRTVGPHILLLQSVVIPVFGRTDQGVLGRRYPVVHLVRLIQFIIEIHLVDNRFHHTLGIIRIINREIAGVADFLRFKTEDPGKDGVKRTNIKVTGFSIAKDLLHPLFHFLGSLIGKGQGQYIKRIHPVGGHQVNNAGGQYLGFTTACTRHNHDRPVFMQYRFPLPVVQAT